MWHGPCPNFTKGKIICKLCKTEVEIDQWFDHLVNAPYHGLHTNQHHLILNLYYYGQLNPKESYKEVPRVNPKGRFLLRLSNFYRKLSEFILLGSPDHPVGEMNLFQKFIFELSSLEIQLRKCGNKLHCTFSGLRLEQFLCLQWWISDFIPKKVKFSNFEKFCLSWDSAWEKSLVLKIWAA